MTEQTFFDFTVSFMGTLWYYIPFLINFCIGIIVLWVGFDESLPSDNVATLGSATIVIAFVPYLNALLVGLVVFGFLDALLDFLDRERERKLEQSRSQSE